VPWHGASPQPYEHARPWQAAQPVDRRPRRGTFKRTTLPMTARLNDSMPMQANA
jgi:hypothetical protein